MEQNKNISRFPSASRNLARRLRILLWIKRGKAVAYLLSILFFTGLLIALATVLETLVRSNWAAISAALRAERPAPASAAPAKQWPPRRRAAA